jgi:hypothetical protein
MDLSRMIRRVLPCLLIFLVLVPTLDLQSLWWDEGISMHLASSSWQSIIIDRASNIHPPLYFFVLKLWVSLAGSTSFSARYLSVLGTTLLPAAVYAFIKPRFDKRSAITGSFLISLAPPFIIYGQEVRAYAFLSLFFISLIGQIWETEQPQWGFTSISSRFRGFLLGTSQVVFVGFHYTGLVAVALSDLYLLLKSIIKKNKNSRQILLSSVMTFVIFSAPWLVLILILGYENIFQQAGISNPLSDPIPFEFLVKLLAFFNVIGIPGALSASYLIRPVILNYILGAAVFLISIFSLKRQKTLSMLIVWWLPFICVPFVWMLSPQSHPRYLMPYFVSGWLLLTVLLCQIDLVKVPRLLLFATTLVSSILGLYSYFFNENYAKSDIRSLAMNLQEQATPGDIVIIPDTDWSLPQYDVGDATIYMRPPVTDNETLYTYITFHKESKNVFLLDYDRGVLDPNGYVRFLLSRRGYLADRLAFNKVFLERYSLTQIDEPIICKTDSSVCVEGEGLCLIGSDVPTQPVSGTMLPIALCWRNGPVNRRYALAFRLYTESGILVSVADDLVLDAALRPSDLWETQSTFTSYHRLAVPLGLLPEIYKLEMSLYPVDTPEYIVSLIREDGMHLPAVEIARVQPSLTRWVSTSPDTVYPDVTLQPVRALPGLWLSGHHIEPGNITPGDSLYVTLLWTIDQGGVPDIVPQIIMQQDNVILLSEKIWGKFGNIPLSRPLVDHIVIPVPVEVTTGDVDLRLSMSPSEEDIDIGRVSIDAIEHDFDVPQLAHPLQADVPGVATIVGYEIEPAIDVEAGQPLTITLIWQAGINAYKYDLKVFVHIVDGEGSVAAQHDAKPVNWTRPTNGWVAGEILIDIHPIQWIETKISSGDIVIGLYDAATGTRLVWDNGEDALKLPIHFDY